MFAGTKFLCSEVIAPVLSPVDDSCLYILNFEELVATQVVAPEDPPSSPLRLSPCEYAS